MKKFLALSLILLLALSVFAGCAPKAEAPEAPATEPVVVKVGASPTPHAEILAVVKPLLAEQGIDLEITEFTDYVLPNMALDSGDIDANYFQHQPYLDDFNKEKGTKLVTIAAIHYEPFGIYPGKTKTLDALADGAKIAVPNDTTNEARALLLLEAQGLIKLKEGVGLNATKIDIVEIEAAQLPRLLTDVDIAVINGNFAIDAGLKVGKDALATESADSEAAQTYANVLVVKEGNETKPELVALANALKSPEVKKFIDETYEGAVVAMF